MSALSQLPGGRHKEQVLPMLDMPQAQKAATGPVEALIADTGYCSEKKVRTCEARGITLYLVVAPEDHHPDWLQRHTEPEALGADAARMQAMIHRLGQYLAVSISYLGISHNHTLQFPLIENIH
ncbi:MAG: hypothetical protein ACYCY2_05400 [Acidithiobacillus ferriphilus]